VVGDFWALWVMSLVLRGLAIMMFAVTLLTSCFALSIPIAGVLTFIYGFTVSLSVYAAGQMILLWISLHNSGARMAGLLQVRRPRTPQPSSDDASYRDDRIATQDNRPNWVRAPAQRRPPRPDVPQDDPRAPRPHRPRTITSKAQGYREPRQGRTVPRIDPLDK